MSNDPPPIKSQLATLEEAEAYDYGFRAKVHASLDDERPPTPHDQVVVAFLEIIEAKRRAHGLQS